MKISELKHNPRNPRTITQDQLDMMGESIARFGDLSGFVFNIRKGQLEGGHQRTKKMPPDAEIHITERYPEPNKVGTVAIGYVMDSNGEKHKYREVDWDDDTAKAANIAANKHGGQFDFVSLSEQMLELDHANFDMRLTGFNDKEFEKLMTYVPVTKIEGKCDEDEVPEAPAEPKTKPGDLYQLGQHRLLCGDATLVDNFAKLMGGQKAHAVWIEPPYNVNYEGGTGLKIMNDSMSDEKFYKFLYDMYSNILMHTIPGSAIYVAHADSEGMNFRKALKDAGWLLKQCIIWVKSSLVMGRQDYHWKHEPILYGWAPGASHNWYSDRRQTTVVEFNKPSKNGEHPTMKPVELVEYFLKNSSRVEDHVIDCFGGSGTTLIACEKLNRKCFMMEMDPKYADVIIARFEKFSGKQAVLIEDNHAN